MLRNFLSQKLKQAFTPISQTKNPFTNQTQKRYFARNFKRQAEDWIKNSKYPLYINIIALNCGVYLAWSLYPGSFFYKNFALSGDHLSSGRIWTLLTYSFSHNNLLHLFANMFGFFFFGSAIEKIFGPRTLLQIYVAGAIMGGLFQISRNNQYYGGSHYLCLGASASLSAVLSFFILNFPYETITVFVFPMPAWVFGTGLCAYSLWNYNSAGGIGHPAHLGGLVAGAGMYFHKRGGIKF